MIMLAAIDIIAENIPDLEALNLNDNKLHGIEHLCILSNKFKNLKILYMGDNRVNSLYIIIICITQLQLFSIKLSEIIDKEIKNS